MQQQPDEPKPDGARLVGVIVGLLQENETVAAGLRRLSGRGQKAGGQALVGGLDCTVCRNYFGAQVSSFELPLEGFPDAAPAVFIRAPAILKRGPTCEALASVTSAPSRDAAPHVETFEPAKKKRKGASGEREVCVAARQGHILATSFHPELTSDSRWHAMFLDMVRERKKEKLDLCPSRVSARPIQDA